MRWYLFWKMLGGILLGVAVLFLVACLKNPCGQRGAAIVEDREYYLYSPSSQACIKKQTQGSEYFFLTGEKFVLSFASDQEAKAYMEQRLRSARVRIVAEEWVDGARSVYAYETGGVSGARLFGQKVNLHLIQNGAFVQVGTPIVFGGY